MNELEKAIKMLADKYEKVKGKDYIYNPIAYALFYTWVEFDRKPTGKGRCGNCKYIHKIDDEYICTNSKRKEKYINTLYNCEEWER